MLCSLEHLSTFFGSATYPNDLCYAHSTIHGWKQQNNKTYQEIQVNRKIIATITIHTAAKKGTHSSLFFDMDSLTRASQCARTCAVCCGIERNQHKQKMNAKDGPHCNCRYCILTHQRVSGDQSFVHQSNSRLNRRPTNRRRKKYLPNDAMHWDCVPMHIQRIHMICIGIECGRQKLHLLKG